MAPVSLTCVADTEFTFKTQELELEVARVMLNMHMKYTHTEGDTGNTTGERERPEKFPQPMLEADATSKALEDFQATWDWYKEEYSLSGCGLIHQLLACCSTDINTSLSRSTCGKPFEKTEEELLTLMKQLAVRQKN